MAVYAIHVCESLEAHLLQSIYPGETFPVIFQHEADCNILTTHACNSPLD